MKILMTLARVIDTINEWIGRGVAWVSLGLVLVVFTDVVMRYLFNISFVFTQELEWHLFAFIFLIIILTSWKFAHTSYAMLEGSPDPGGIPLRFIVKSLIPVGFSLLCLQGLSLGIHSLLQILGIESVKEEGV
ncbi:MAG: hypothetical protein P8Y74_00620 [Desulfobacterales bacterium]